MKNTKTFIRQLSFFLVVNFSIYLNRRVFVMLFVRSTVSNESLRGFDTYSEEVILSKCFASRLKRGLLFKD